MQVAKWGNSLAVGFRRPWSRLWSLRPATRLKSPYRAAAGSKLRGCVAPERALAGLRKFRGRLPAGFKFDRDEANERR